MQRTRKQSCLAGYFNQGGTLQTRRCHFGRDNPGFMITEVCVVSASPDLTEQLHRALGDERVCVEPVLTAEEAIKRASCGCSAAILIDEEPSDMATAEVLRRLAIGSCGNETLVVLLSSRASEMDRVIAFELGADDFIPKPIGSRELALRLKAVLRRHRDLRSRPRRLCAGPFVIDTQMETVTCDGQTLRLTSVEFRLLEHLVRNLGQVQERRELLARVWRWCEATDGRAGASRTVDTHVKRLREKLGPASDFIETIRGVGYRFRLAS